ncbi:MAG: hypothetical protein M1835_007915, partial [Candelina submexicana]
DIAVPASTAPPGAGMHRSISSGHAGVSSGTECEAAWMETNASMHSCLSNRGQVEVERMEVCSKIRCRFTIDHVGLSIGAQGESTGCKTGTHVWGTTRQATPMSTRFTVVVYPDARAAVGWITAIAALPDVGIGGLR